MAPSVPTSSTSSEIRIRGGGLAGSAAALAALATGARVVLEERSHYPRHKVCGEFLSPEAARLLDALGVWGTFSAAQPAVMRRIKLTIGARTMQASLPETAWGLSRYRFDHLMFNAAAAAGATVSDTPGKAQIDASGRLARAAKGDRLFGFKAHFAAGSAGDAVELYFFPNGGYAGVSPVEGGVTNVCGLAPESVLSAHGFDMDEVIAGWPALRERLQGYERSFRWLTTGPVVMRNELAALRSYRAGDALSFVDPFTGTGMVSALYTGKLAGEFAGRGIAAEEYARACRAALAKPYLIAGVFRELISRGWAEWLAPLVPASWLFRATRPVIR